MKELLLDLMRKVEDLKAEQVRHHTFAEAKLSTIEAQAIKTNGRVTKNEDNITLLKEDASRAKTIFSTLSAVLMIVWSLVTFVFR